jgi:C4-dicarboxylate-specific signal transduction histidine kinase
VIVNLLNNAFDAARDSNEKWIRLDASDGLDHTIQIAIEDSGSGVPAEIEASMYRPFFTTKPVGVGTGLGLSISRVIVESHGGTLDLDRSAPHTRFRVILPRLP